MKEHREIERNRESDDYIDEYVLIEEMLGKKRGCSGCPLRGICRG